MNILIIYTSKHGFTQECADYLATNIPHKTVVVDLDITYETSFDEYDWIIIGSPIYMGDTRKKVRTYCQENLAELLQQKVALFISCAISTQVDEYFKKGFPPQLYKNAKVSLNFGGELRRNQLNLYERKLTDMVLKKQAEPQGLLYENMEQLIELIGS
ncbi:flavodoxin domain-containing protein [Tetragenococcus halophilus]|uniref:flavodoxin domain-containing protein n=1 Tax=Tetragenococcus halophilus TaxID=51669 RepID=UPI001F23DA5D|nr:flavodoxin domain-containing protein [Tetragenococcus halophilus]MCF1685599.1 flavodoxin domain-containing protein [Tetragenococcus halophilus]